MLLSELADTYEPVHFNHSLHAGMAEMNDSCVDLSPLQPAGKNSRRARSATAPNGNPNNLRQPGLKGAYHRQCLSCHREWSHDTKCVVCHLPVTRAGETGRHEPIRPTSSAVSHPVITRREESV